MRLLALSLCLALAGAATTAHAERTLLSETCNTTDVTTVWFEAFYQTVTLTTTTRDGEDGNLVARQLTFQDGRIVDLPAGSNFLYDAAGISCETYIAVAKSTVLQSLSSGQRYDNDVHEDYKAIMRGEDPCVTPDQSEACSAQDLDVLYINQPVALVQQALDSGTHAILTLREQPFGLTTYALNMDDLSLIALFYEGT